MQVIGKMFHRCQHVIQRRLVPKRIILARSNQIFPLNLVECKDDTDPAHEVNYIEQVQVFVTLLTDRRGEIEIYLYSPSNTRTQLLPVSFVYLFYFEKNCNVIATRT